MYDFRDFKFFTLCVGILSLLFLAVYTNVNVERVVCEEKCAKQMESFVQCPQMQIPPEKTAVQKLDAAMENYKQIQKERGK